MNKNTSQTTAQAVGDHAFYRNMHQAQTRSAAPAYLLWFFLGGFGAHLMYTRRWVMLGFHYLFLILTGVGIAMVFNNNEIHSLGVGLGSLWLALLPFGMFNFLGMCMLFAQVNYCNEDAALLLAGRTPPATRNTEQLTIAVSGILFAIFAVTMWNTPRNTYPRNGGDLSSTRLKEQVPQEAPMPQAYVGDVLQNGTFQVMLEEVRTGTSINSDFSHSNAADGGQYVVIIAMVKNISAKPVSAFDMPSIHLFDQNNTKYDRDIDSSISASSAFGDNSKSLSDLNPGLSTRVVTSFEVSKSLFNAGTWRVGFDNMRFNLVPKSGAQPARNQLPENMNTGTQSAAESDAQAAAQAAQNAAEEAGKYAQYQAQVQQEAQAPAKSESGSDFTTYPNQIFATSFDCNNSRTQNEYLICHTPGLAAQDVKLGNSVFAVKKMFYGPDLDALKNRMRGQWNFREKHCNDVSCLDQWFTYQIKTMALIGETKNVAARVDIQN
ncbi:DUF4352 domain-containing protein [Burkholderia vietnamiensis]|uniref:DUF4352 domain-containing protein n=1 Tax=Burkholderia vietnamiensis TaxID=60552 RepID=UPI001CF2EE1F|nr:DUF4352 domain-containing protein [Burkholderia vietnamiensis]MCA8144454.1 DUF4352 domain-containing protein [Burkholderia vietnamiensis]